MEEEREARVAVLRELEQHYGREGLFNIGPGGLTLRENLTRKLRDRKEVRYV